MKCSMLLILLAFCAFAAAAGENKIREMYVGLATIFSIQMEEVETCVHKFGTTSDDFINFADVVFKDRENDAQPDSLRKATCALTCCAQAQGTMNGRKINLPEIRYRINKENMPAIAKNVYVEAVNECGEQVKDIADECEIGFAFVKCLVTKTRDFNEYA